ncbi:Putative transposase of IS4/5 family protein [Phaeobacter gallaeciensis]|uniref:Transposase of IS4/5 family protein n=1 Tax=Phaeobacter gallaeciensis TaxID=60890 RepID=A0AAC9ZBK1_9RHOB|nr:Putative transposase of IS4/5 family [Phaeobacter gallaeciensis DSM 26640]ATE94268.1 Putative transposase of IS4/5 family protein [Phaeobacter gallaeciensis]ATE95911.1 Putative transposase of IS4/5 family protein [Phaeobacter gallaeciensis]ATF02932.1 Putative transposase of IS4/5 family protein [Phaeobacter gallaeciensis]ATF07312.1 Putative transposase of IS4/5 family protein [Phaeobacter gallaeciensis]
MKHLKEDFRGPHGIPWVAEKRVHSGIVFINRDGLCWYDAHNGCGGYKALCNRWNRWGEKGASTLTMIG